MRLPLMTEPSCSDKSPGFPAHGSINMCHHIIMGTSVSMALLWAPERAFCLAHTLASILFHHSDIWSGRPQASSGPHAAGAVGHRPPVVLMLLEQ
eukprot:superscaffoldBa00009085_g23845